MAKPKPAEKKVSDYRFIRHTLTVDEKARFDDWSITAEQVLARVRELVDLCYKVSTSLDFYNHTCQASLTCNEIKSPDTHWILVARAPDAMTALELLIFKHDILMGGNWSAYHDEDEGSRAWG